MPIHLNTEPTQPSQDLPGASVPHFPPHPDPRHALPRAGSRRTGIWIVVAVLLILLLLGVSFRFFQRSDHEHQLASQVTANAKAIVNVVEPTVSGAGNEIALPGNTQPFDDTPIYARTNGYLKQWFVDIGQHVRKGELMATIETPEIDEQLQVAKANLKSAQADQQLAKTTAARYQNLLKSDSVSKQETDVAVSTEAAKQAAVDAAEANLRRLQELQSFEKIYAPFSGVVTERNTDIGALIDAGSATTSNSAKELFRIAAIDKLRVFVPVPEIYAPDIHNGEMATLTLDEYPGQKFTGTVARNSSAIDPATRTLNVEVDVNNAAHKLLPGAYVFVHFNIPAQQRMLSIPADTLLFRKNGLQVALVQDGHVHLQPVKIGKDNGRTVQIATGLSPGEQIILDPSDSIAEGQSVQIDHQAQEAQ